MDADRFQSLTSRYPRMRLAVVGDFCLDRYLEIDPAHVETSIETGLPVHNVVNVRAQPGGAGTIVNNLAALGVGEIIVVGFRGDDGEGFELERALRAIPGVNTGMFVRSPLRKTFVYGKPLIIESGQLPRELSRLDTKNWSPTPLALQQELARHVIEVSRRVDAMIVLEQVDLPETGVVTGSVLAAVSSAVVARPEMVVLADSRRGVAHLPPLGYKINAAELGLGDAITSLADVKRRVSELATKHRQPVFVTLAERGIVGALADGAVQHVPAHPASEPIDVVGAGDAVTANLTTALAAGANLVDAMTLAMAAASVVIHQLGTTGVATVEQIRTVISRGA